MTTVKVNINLGEPTVATSLISIQAELRKQEIEKHQKDLSQKLKKYNLPFVVMQIPKAAKSFPLPRIITQLFRQKHYQMEEVQRNGIFYWIYSLRSPLVVGLISKIQKIFKEITHLQNKLSLKIRLHNVDDFNKKIKQKQYDVFTTLLDKASIEGQVDLDGKFIETVGLLFNTISPGFSDSPIMTALQVFGDLSLDLELYSPADLPLKTRIKYTEDILPVEQPDQEQSKQLIKTLTSIVQPTTIYIHFKTLGFIKIQFETRIFGFLHSIFGIPDSYKKSQVEVNKQQRAYL